MRAGFVGLGRMGLPMARHAVAAGHEVVGVDVAPEALGRARDAGLEASAELTTLTGVDVICSSLPNTPEVRDTYLGSTGLLSILDPGTICFDLSTIAIEGSLEVAAAADAAGVAYLDSPVSGTSIHAEAGTLAIMVGGDPAALEKGRQVLEPFSSAVYHVGANGDGLRLKLITNRLLATYLGAVAEAVVEMETAGLDPAAGLEVIKAGAVPRLLDYKSRPLTERDFTPQFTVGLMHKDLGLAADAFPPGRLGSVSKGFIDALADQGLGELDVAAVISIVEEHLTSAGEAG